MNTIDNNVVQRAAEVLINAVAANETVHTLTITLNGQHGGADLIIESEGPGPDFDSRKQVFAIH